MTTARHDVIVVGAGAAGMAAAASQLAMGEIISVTFSFAERFWDKLPADNRTLSNLYFLFSDDEVFPTWWTLAPDNPPILTGWSPAASARRERFFQRRHAHAP